MSDSLSEASMADTTDKSSSPDTPKMGKNAIRKAKIKAAIEAEEEAKRVAALPVQVPEGAESLPYKPSYRETPADSVLVPITEEEIAQIKARSLNPLRQTAPEPPQPSEAVVRKRSETNSPSTGAVAEHYNKRRDVGRDARESSPIIPLKRFNNWIKSALIAMYAKSAAGAKNQARVLDMGCGKGGDLQKWARQHPSMLVMIDIAEISVQQAKERYESGHFRWPAEFFTFDCFQKRLEDVVPLPLLEPMFDTVSLQFCMHYGWDTEEHARTMLANVARYLRVGGTFIGTTLDAETLMGRLDALPDPDALSFGNENYRIEFEERLEPGQKPFGNKYRFWLEDAVDDVPEYVVDWAMFESIAGEYGLQLQYKARFDQVLADGYANSNLRALLERMRVIDPQLAATGVVTPDMPSPMWDVCTLYLGFAFEKVAT